MLIATHWAPVSPHTLINVKLLFSYSIIISLFVIFVHEYDFSAFFQEFRDLERFHHHNYQNSFRSTSLLTHDRSSPSHSSSSDEVFSPNVPIKRNPYRSHIMRIQSEPSSFYQSNDVITRQNEKFQLG